MWRYYKTKRFRQLMDTLNTLTKYVNICLYFNLPINSIDHPFSLVSAYVNDAVVRMDKLEQEGKNKEGEESVLQKLLRVDRKYATLMVFDMIIAGIDTTASTSSIFLYHLATNPEQQAKVTEEIFKMLPEVDTPLTEDILNNMPYFRACMKESMRLQPLIPAHLRGAGQDLILNGYQIPKTVRLLLEIDYLYFANN